jgi:hypothetical protein
VSDVSQSPGAGWWLASDREWYPPPPPPEGEKTWWRKWPTWVPIAISLLAFGASIGVPAWQGHTTSNQNKTEAQEELVTLLSDITQANNVLSTTTPSGSNATQLGQTNNLLLAESEEAAGIINKTLHGQGVSAIEYYEVAQGLEQGEDFATALSLLETAQQLHSDPVSSTDIFREKARILYILGRNRAAGRDIQLAEDSFTGTDVTAFDRQDNVALTETFDAEFQASEGHCKRAQQELLTAQQWIEAHRTGGHPGASESRDANYANQNLIAKGCSAVPGW